jgi:hypothetical protein
MQGYDAPESNRINPSDGSLDEVVLPKSISGSWTVQGKFLCPQPQQAVGYLMCFVEVVNHENN